MVKELAGVGGLDDGAEPSAGRRGVVRFLHEEAAPAAARMVLGNALRHFRADAKLKQETVAALLGGSTSKISRIETGVFRLKPADLETLLRVLQVTNPADRRVLRELASFANERAWWQPWSPVAQPYLLAVVSYEDLARRIRSFEALYLHGLLQTAEYGQALIRRGRGGPLEHERLLELREERQKRFAAVPENRLVCVIAEGALRNPVGSGLVMRRQIEHLLDLMSDPRYQLRIAAQGDPRVHLEIGTTTVFDFSEKILPTLVYAESFEGGLIIDDEMMVDRRVKAFDALRAVSLAPPATRRKLQDLRSLYR
ncbi:helix-turn-helix domain-containing protein [Streptomyces xanthochromogenes]|uniref:Transcriptional regulator n=1 Tax=Streptomyces xanthochromogenes TaxID=67384 RepID=A0ABQ3ALY9_9ACTN|nr:helix-turn-helix transcriptional regulator [Streptomyces xanthochromogenes]GGY61489.1 transcriptional regulator [Streptomyces xanthochromogenes]